jgi:hypothetical protein
MKLVMTMLVRDEADIVDEQIAFHLNVGVDFVIALDHRSCDGTSEILSSYARDGYLTCIREEGAEVRQSEWVTRLARLAAGEHGADWVINADADEFFWPRAQSLKEALGAVPAEYGVVYGPICHFLPSGATGSFDEFMTIRLLETASINNPLSRHRPSLKAAHRGDPCVVVLRGNHEVESGGNKLYDWHPFEVLHFPDRSPEQRVRKYTHTVEAWPTGGREPGAFVLAALASMERAGIAASFERLAVSDQQLAEAGSALVVDTRLRDALRQLRSNHGVLARPHDRHAPFDLPLPTTVDNARHAVETAALGDAELIRVHRQVDDLGVRAHALEHRAFS